MSDRLDNALKAYLKSKGIEAISVYVDSEIESYSIGGCSTCHYTETAVKYTLNWRDKHCAPGMEEFDNMAELMWIAVEYSE